MNRWLAACLIGCLAVLVLAGCAAEESEPPVAEGALRTVFLGDSITEGVPADTLGQSDAESWVTYAVADPRSPWALGVNAGVSGETLDQMALRFDRDVVDADPQAVVIMGGTNDVLRGLPTDQSVAAVRQMVEAAQAAGLEVWLVAPPPIDAGYARSVAPLVEAERALADELGVPFSDPSDGLAADDGSWPPGLSFDGVHPTAEGAEALADAVLDDVGGLTGSR